MHTPQHVSVPLAGAEEKECTPKPGSPSLTLSLGRTEHPAKCRRDMLLGPRSVIAEQAGRDGLGAEV